MNTKQSNNGIIVILALIVVVALAFSFFNMPDRRTTGEKIGDAVDALPQGADKAVRQLENRTPAEKLGDAVQDTKRDLKQ